MSKRPLAAVFDVDGTLALHHARNPYDWLSADKDDVRESVVFVLRSLHRSGLTIVYVSGRPEPARDITEGWLRANVSVPGPLYLRATSDGRRDSLVKREIFEERIQPYFDVVAVFDDRDQVVRMWREELGLTCFQVAPGDF